MPEVDLSTFDNSWYSPGRGRAWQALWFFAGLPLLRCAWLPGSAYRRALLRLFGAEIGAGVVIKPGVRVKYPWRLKVGAHSWLGEDCWIDNLGDVTIGSNCCLSQGVYLCTGNHDWSDPAFGLRVGPIVVEEGAWVAARATLAPGVRVGRNAVVGMGSTATRDVDAGSVVQGVPAAPVGRRRIGAREDRTAARSEGSA